jgi:predicted CXXCH cytochrome family protein
VQRWRISDGCSTDGLDPARLFVPVAVGRGREGAAGRGRPVRSRALMLAGTCTLLSLALPAAIAISTAQPPSAATVDPPTTAIPRGGCITADCHVGVKDHEHLHGPVHANACDACHTLTDAAKHTFVQARSGSETCLLCHVIDIPFGSTMHEPVAKGECLSCHDPHGSTEPALLRGETYADSCKSCHKNTAGARDHVHGPASAGACGACHQPHASRFPNLLIAEGRELCLRCHVSTGLEIESRRVVHKAVLTDCLICHAAHGTDTRGLLLAKPAVLCTSCHVEIAAAMGQATTQHAAVTTGRDCLNCHTAHASDRPLLLRNDERELCFDCHNTTIKLEDGTVLANIKSIMEKGKSIHGAIAERSCAPCHQIHGGEHRRLLTEEYPLEFYREFSEGEYGLCFTCHDLQLVLAAETEAVTGFRNGTTNLHNVHVNREKSRSCRICHDSHAAERERHIRSEIPFGPLGWMLPIRFERLPDGGSCAAGCHRAYEYNRTTPIVYPTAEPGGAWEGLDLVPGVRAAPPGPPPPPPRRTPRR